VGEDVEFINEDTNTPLPTKVLGEHRWILIAVHTIGEEAIQSGHTGKIGKDNLVGFSIGCADCALDRVEAFRAPCLASAEEAANVDKAFGPHYDPESPY
jgi:hypothetical protein